MQSAHSEDLGRVREGKPSLDPCVIPTVRPLLPYLNLAIRCASHDHLVVQLVESVHLAIMREGYLVHVPSMCLLSLVLYQHSTAGIRINVLEKVINVPQLQLLIFSSACQDLLDPPVLWIVHFERLQAEDGVLMGSVKDLDTLEEPPDLDLFHSSCREIRVVKF